MQVIVAEAGHVAGWSVQGNDLRWGQNTNTTDWSSPSKSTPPHTTAPTPTMAQRSQLALTTELEKLEQSITLTLQGTPTFPRLPPAITTPLTRLEIDHNFARAHRIVTTSILPIVDRYAKESDAVWEGSKVPPHSLPHPTPL